MTGPATDWPIVIYGAARSGTTYLVQLLNQHPEVYVTDEARVFDWAHAALRDLMADIRSTLRDADAPGGSRIGDRSAFEEHVRREAPRTIRSYYRELAPAARWWGDKNPHYADPLVAGCLDSILALFPAARFLHLVRDGRDVVTSGLRGVWTDFESVHAMWTGHLDVGAGFGRALPAEQYLELRYEELVADDLAMARRIFDFLGIDLHPRVERFCRDQQRRRTPYCTPTRDIRSDVRRSDWSSFLDTAQQRRSLDLLGEHLVRFGYETPESLAAARARLAAGEGAPAATREAAAVAAE
jgi:hypothetical protein